MLKEKGTEPFALELKAPIYQEVIDRNKAIIEYPKWWAKDSELMACTSGSQWRLLSYEMTQWSMFLD